MSQTKLILTHVFGAANGHGLGLIDSTTVAYISGANLVILDTDSGSQKIIKVADTSSTKITSVSTCSSTKKIAVAFSTSSDERNDTFQIAIFDGSTRKRLKTLPQTTVNIIFRLRFNTCSLLRM